jgi:hypothetical protein
VPVARHGTIWLSCRAHPEPVGILRRLLTLDLGHLARPVVELDTAA